MKLMVEAGEFASAYQDIAHRKLTTTRVEADEIWAFVGAKQRRAVRPGDGYIWTFTAVDADSKLILSWLVGPRGEFRRLHARCALPDDSSDSTDDGRPRRVSDGRASGV